MTKREIVENLVQAYDKWRLAHITEKYWIHVNMYSMIIHSLKTMMRADPQCPKYVLSYIKRRNITLLHDENMRLTAFRIYNDEVNGYICMLNNEFSEFFKKQEGTPDKAEVLIKDEPLIDFTNIDKITF